MSRLSELINELCPDGVEYKRLGDIATISRGGSFQKRDYIESGVPCIHYGQIYTIYNLYLDKTVSFISEEKAVKQKKATSGDIIMAVTSENIEDVCKCVAWLGEGEIAVSGHTAIIHHELEPKYLSYYLNSNLFYKQKVKLAHGTKVIEVTPSALDAILLPVPPLEVQREIVRILDSFTLLTAELTAKLTAELTARQQQYKYYSKYLLCHAEGAVDTPIEELGKWQGGKTPSMANPDYWNNGSIPWISSKDMKVAVLEDTQDHITNEAISNGGMKLLPAGVTAIVTRSGILKHTFPVAYVPVPCTINQDIKALIVKEDVDSRFAALAIQAFSDDIRVATKKQGGTVDSLEFGKILSFKIPVPPLDEQLRVVQALDRFDSICNDIASGIPAEIEARQKQYEYYRDKLLTFKEKEA